VGPTLEAETWNPGRVLTNKINMNHTYLNDMSYCAPLDNNNEEEEEEKIDNANKKPIDLPAPDKTNKWMR
jgi:hypothetical protein